MSRAIQPSLFSESEARTLTDEVKQDAQTLWTKLLRLYEGGAHTALGYPSWAAYCAEEFEYGQRHSYELLDAGRIAAMLPASAQLRTGVRESQLRELAPLKDHPEAVREVWQEVHEEHGDRATARDIREAVQRRIEPQEPTLGEAVAAGEIEVPWHLLEKPRSETAFNKICDLRTYVDDVDPGEVAATYGSQQTRVDTFDQIGRWILAISAEMRNQIERPVRVVKGGER